MNLKALIIAIALVLMYFSTSIFAVDTADIEEHSMQIDSAVYNGLPVGAAEQAVTHAAGTDDRGLQKAFEAVMQGENLSEQHRNAQGDDVDAADDNGTPADPNEKRAAADAHRAQAQIRAEQAKSHANERALEARAQAEAVVEAAQNLVDETPVNTQDIAENAREVADSVRNTGQAAPGAR